jgi:AcrR family transcriptional regulator
MRVDAERNRRKLIDAAHAVFAERGLDAGVDEVARAAGVGMGTLYRRFPTKDALVQAILDARFEALQAAFTEAAAADDAWDAFAGCALALARAIAEDRGFFEVVSQSDVRVEQARATLIASLEPVVERAQRAGVVRRDVTAADLPSVCAVAARLPRTRLEREPEVWRRYLGIVLDGLRPDGATPLPA